MHQLFARQHGAASDAQLHELDVPYVEIGDRLRRGDWQRPCPGVLVNAGAPPTWHQSVTVATLVPGRPSLTYGASLRLHRLDGYQEHEPIDVVLTRGRHPELPAGVTGHTSRRLSPGDVTVVAGVRTMTLATSLVLAAGVEPRQRIEQALDSALRKGASPAWLRQASQRWAGRGVAGSGVLAELLADRIDRRLPRSWFERLAQRALQDLGITLEHEVPVHSGRRLLASLDLADARWKVGVECQSWEWHSSPAAQRRDLERKRLLRRLGWDIVELWWSDLHRMDSVVADIDVAVRRQRVLVGGAA